MRSGITRAKTTCCYSPPRMHSVVVERRYFASNVWADCFGITRGPHNFLTERVLVAIGINWEGRRSILAVELASRESLSSWKELLASLRHRSLHGVEFVVSDDHAGLRRAIQETLPEAVWQRCYVHFLRNALDYLPRKADDDCLQELRWIL